MIKKPQDDRINDILFGMLILIVAFIIGVIVAMFL